MSCRVTVAALILACLPVGTGGHAHAQSVLPLKGTIDAEGLVDSVIPISNEPELEIAPLETPETPPREARAANDPYAPIGFGNNGLRFFPSIAAGTVYSSNINESDKDPQSGIGLQLKPGFTIESDWIRHALTAGLDGNLTRYPGHTGFDTAKLDVFERLRLDVRRNTTANINSSYALDDSGGTEATEHSLTGSLAVSQDFGPMKASLTAAANARVFEDAKLGGGGIEDNGDRDYVEPSLALRTTFNEYGPVKPYLEAGFAPRIHGREIDRNGINRDSTGYSTTAGVEIDSGPIWTGDLGLTYLHRNYDAASLGAADTIGLTGSVTWNPTELTKIVLETGTALDETTSVDTPASAKWTASAELTYALRDNVDLLAKAAIEIEDNSSSIDKTYDGSVGLEWKFNPVLAWTAAYDITWLDSGTVGNSYVEHRISTGLTVSR